MYITPDCLKKSQQIKQIYLSDGSEINCKLSKPIDDSVLHELNNLFVGIKKQMEQDPTFDYLGTIAQTLESYGLNNI
jgi:hypothetical protein